MQGIGLFDESFLSRQWLRTQPRFEAKLAAVAEKRAAILFNESFVNEGRQFDAKWIDYSLIKSRRPPRRLVLTCFTHNTRALGPAPISTFSGDNPKLANRNR